jgi:hypothetical protein
LADYQDRGGLFAFLEMGERFGSNFQQTRPRSDSPCEPNGRAPSSAKTSTTSPTSYIVEEQILCYSSSPSHQAKASSEKAASERRSQAESCRAQVGGILLSQLWAAHRCKPSSERASNS